MVAKFRVHALMILLLAGFVPAGHASVTLELRSVDAQSFELAQDDGTISVQMTAPGVLRVHYLPMDNKTPPSLVMDPQRAPATTFKPDVSRHGGVVTLRSKRMVVDWNPESATLSIA